VTDIKSDIDWGPFYEFSSMTRSRMSALMTLSVLKVFFFGLFMMDLGEIKT